MPPRSASRAQLTTAKASKNTLMQAGRRPSSSSTTMSCSTRGTSTATTNTPYTSFSMAKSFASALVGIAIDEGRIKSVDEPITNYIPELLKKDKRFESITIRHLLTMSSGIKYEEGGDLPWSEEADDTKTYYATDLRKLALENSRIEGEPGVLRVQQLQPPADRDDTREGNGDECLPLPTAEAVETHGHGGGRLLEPGQHAERL